MSLFLASKKSPFEKFSKILFTKKKNLHVGFHLTGFNLPIQAEFDPSGIRLHGSVRSVVLAFGHFSVVVERVENGLFVSSQLNVLELFARRDQRYL